MCGNKELTIDINDLSKEYLDGVNDLADLIADYIDGAGEEGPQETLVRLNLAIVGVIDTIREHRTSQLKDALQI